MKYTLFLLLILAACNDSGNKESQAAAPAPVAVDTPVTSAPAVAEPDVTPQQQLAPAGLPDTLMVRLERGDELRPGQVIVGKARGFFFHEAQFTLRLFDSSGRQLAAAPATAEGEWMTTNWVTFMGSLRWKNYSGAGTLVYEKANPSGDAERDRQFAIPLRLEAGEQNR
ncbi:MAG: hypothetical protein EOO16_13275 [Chitinophagaceae bacterium]|nr:MAG: hypothetical protein EOO16_13275 [Chitinophagaceae bacterium]